MVETSNDEDEFEDSGFEVSRIYVCKKQFCCYCLFEVQILEEVLIYILDFYHLMSSFLDTCVNCLIEALFYVVS